MKIDNKHSSKKFYERLLFAVLLNLAVLALLTVIFHPAYDTNDDFGICNIVNGSKGTYDPHIIYSNYILGLVYTALYKGFGAIPWYPVIHYAVMFTSFVSITYVLINRLKHSSSVWICTILILVFGYQGYILMQFTRTASIATVGGLILMFWAFSECNEQSKRIKVIQVVSGGLIAVIGFMYRDIQFTAIAGIMSAIGVMTLIEMVRRGRGERLKPFVLIVISFVVMFASIGALSIFDKSKYKSDEWVKYRTYNNARSSLYDHGFPEYQEYEENYKELGINENAKNYYRQWNHIDLSTNTMSEIASWNDSDSQESGIAFVKKFIKKICKGFLMKPSFYVFILFAALWFAFGRKNLQSIVGIIYAALVTTGLYAYMFMGGRYLKDRVDAGIILALCVIVIWTYKNNKALFSNRVGIAAVAVIFALMQFVWHDNWRINCADKLADMNSNKIVAQEIASDKDHLYLNKAVGFSYSDAYDVFDVIPFGISENVYTLGGWTAMMPQNQMKLKKYGINDVYEDSINNEKVYIIDKDIDVTIKYIDDYYDNSATYELVKNIRDYPVYRLKGDNK